MAELDRLAQDRPSAAPDYWPDAAWGTTRASALVGSDRRLEAEAYLSDGYGRRQAVESRRIGWRPFGEYADVWQPGRLTGVVVSADGGTPYLAPGQIFEARPNPRRWLSVSKTKGADQCLVDPGTILVTRSGSVGRATVAYKPEVGCIVSDDLLRVHPKDARMHGWIYSYLRTEFFRSVAVSAHYGHVVKHLEVGHLEQMPVIEPPPRVVRAIDKLVRQVFELRDQSWDLVAHAEGLYADAVGELPASAGSVDEPFTIDAQSVASRRRRLDAYHHNPVVTAIDAAFARRAKTVALLRDEVKRIILPTRFRRAFGHNGTPYRSAEELFDLNPPVSKRIYAALVSNAEDYLLRSGWIAMACSGQLYGLNGSVVLLNDRHEGVFGSHDLIRIVPDEHKIRSGYLLAVLGHPTLGRPMVLRHGYGTSIPHLEAGDVGTIPIPRFDSATESPIAEAMESAAELRAEADSLEDDAVEMAESVIEEFLRS